MTINRNRAIAGAKRFAAADRSDPFAFNRAITHINNGIVSAHGDGGDSIYDAEETVETRHLPPGIILSNGDTSYQVPGFKNIKRP